MKSQMPPQVYKVTASKNIKVLRISLNPHHSDSIRALFSCPFMQFFLTIFGNLWIIILCAYTWQHTHLLWSYLTLQDLYLHNAVGREFVFNMEGLRFGSQMFSYFQCSRLALSHISPPHYPFLMYAGAEGTINWCTYNFDKWILWSGGKSAGTRILTHKNVWGHTFLLPTLYRTSQGK